MQTAPCLPLPSPSQSTELLTRRHPRAHALHRLPCSPALGELLLGKPPPASHLLARPHRYVYASSQVIPSRFIALGKVSVGLPTILPLKSPPSPPQHQPVPHNPILSSRSHSQSVKPSVSPFPPKNQRKGVCVCGGGGREGESL